MTQISILNVLMEHMEAWLYQQLVTDVEEEDDTALGLIKVGKLQDDPTILMKNLMIHPRTKSPNDNEDEWHTPHIDGYNGVHGIDTAYLIGGGYHAYWWRKFRLEFQLFFLDEQNRNVARRKSNVIISRSEHAIHTMPMPIWDGETGELSDGTGENDTQTDSFGESPSLVLITATHEREGGGPGDFIWRVEMTVEWLTEKETG